jgi:hypothetical protein
MLSEVAYDPVKHLSSALFPYDQSERVMAFFTAYFDESYASPNPPIYTVAGYISTDRRWVKWQKRWKRVLENLLLPDWQATYGEKRPLAFHMTEFDNPNDKVYGSWPQAKKINLLKQLHEITKECYLRSFSTGVVMSDYNQLSDVQKYALGSPHMCAAINCVKRVAFWADQHQIHEPILYVFEKGTVDDPQMNRLFNLDMEEESRKAYRIEKFAFDNKVNMPPLQSADSLAYETRKELSRRIDSSNTRNMRRSIQSLSVPLLDEWFIMDATEFQKIFDSDYAKQQLAMEQYQAAATEYMRRQKAKKH